MNSIQEVSEIITDEDNTNDIDLEATKYEGVDMMSMRLIKVRKGQGADSDSSKARYPKYYKQTYRPEWEILPDFKGWLKGVNGAPTRAYCIYCQKTLHAHRLSLLKHTCTIRHQKAAQTYTSQVSIQKTEKDATTSKEKNHEMEIIISEDGILSDDTGEYSQIIYSQDEADDDSNDQEQEEDDSKDEEFEENEEADEETTEVDKPDNSVSIIRHCKAPAISTNVVDMIKGTPVTGLSVSLYKLVEGRWTYMNEGLTDSYGRVSDFVNIVQFSSGRYKLHYDIDRYFDAKKQTSMFPFIETVFDADVTTRYHFPLLLSPNSYTTYRSHRDH